MKNLYWLTLLTYFTTNLFAEKAAYHGFNKLKKITVGPYDNYQGEEDSSGNLYFTRRANLLNHLYMQDNKGIETLLLDDSANAKDPRLSPDGLRLAFTYFKFDAKGEVCIITLPFAPEKEPTCFGSSDAKTFSPFWFSKNELGFIEKKIENQQSELVHIDLLTKKREVLLAGEISSPEVSSNGSYIVLSKQIASSKKREIYFGNPKELKSLKIINFDIPGLSGFLKFSPDEHYLYFSHYLSDTNYDQVIDANDNSVIFRIPVANLIAASQSDRAIFPEQISSVENNCNFPSPSKDKLVLTCAHEGSLDIYSTELSGMVPDSWNINHLKQAQESSRTFEERLLIINSLRYKKQKSDDLELIQRLLSNHMELKETTAALFYIEKLQQNFKSDDEKNFYALLALYIQALEMRKQEPEGRNSLAFKQNIDGIIKKIQKIESLFPLKNIILSYCQYFINHDSKIDSRLNTIGQQANLRPLERYLAIDLLTQISTKQNSSMLKYLEKAFLDLNLSNESRIFYTLSYLKELAKIFARDIDLRSKEIDSALAKIKETKGNDDVGFLLDFEKSIFALLKAKDAKEEQSKFQDLDKKMTQYKDRYFLRRAIYNRTIDNLNTFAKQSYLERIASTWLRHTKTSDTEFFYAASQYNFATMDKAYELISEQKNEEAAQVFLMGVRQTDDLEAHFGLVHLRISIIKNADRLSKELEQLKSQNIISETFDFAKILVDLENIKDPKAAQEVINQLEKIGPVGFNHAIYYQILGYLYHLRIINERKGYQYDKSVFKKAHQAYILALDSGKDNERMQAGTLTLLSQLHSEVGNHDIASLYFSLREKLPFLDILEQKAFYFFYSRTLFYSHLLQEALTKAEKGYALCQGKNDPDTMVFKERIAFYALYAEKYPTAEEAYEQILKDPKFNANINNLAKAQLALGYILVKKNEIKKAEPILRAAIESATKAQPIKQGDKRLVAFRPERIKIVAYGLLARRGLNTPQRISDQIERIKLLEKIEGKFDLFATSESLWRTDLAQDYSQLALLYEANHDLAAMRKALFDAFAARGNAVLTDTLSYRTLLNLYSTAIQYPNIFLQDLPEFKKHYDAAMSEYDNIYKISSSELYKRTKLELFFLACSMQNKSSKDLEIELAKILETERAKKVEAELPEKYLELKGYLTALTSR